MKARRESCAGMTKLVTYAIQETERMGRRKFNFLGLDQF